MKVLPSGLGAEPKKLVFLGVLLSVLVVVYFMNRNPSSPEAELSHPNQPVPRPIAPGGRTRRKIRRGDAAARAACSARFRELDSGFKPSLKPPEGTDVSRIDPTRRLDEIAKLPHTRSRRRCASIFDFGTAPPPKICPP